MGRGKVFHEALGAISTAIIASVVVLFSLWAGGQRDTGPYALTISEPQDLAVRIGNGSLSLTWSQPEIGASTLTGYNLYRAVGDDGMELLVALGPTVLQHIDSGLVNGRVYRYMATAFNTLEESDPSLTVKAAPDGTPPSLDILTPAGSAYVPSSTVLVSWEAEDPGSGLQRFDISVDAAPFSTIGLDTSREIHDLDEGRHNVRVRATDKAGNEGTSTVDFTVDTEAPLLNVLTPTEGEVLTDQEVLLSWTAEDANGRIRELSYSLDDERSVVLGPNVTSKEVYADDGGHTITFECMDMAGNLAREVVDFYVDLEPPLLKLLKPVDGSYTNSSNIICSWYSADSATTVGCSISMDAGKPLSVPSSDNMTFFGLNDGWHRVDIIARDGAGRTIEASSRFMVDTIAPLVELTGPELDHPVPTKEPLLTWKVVESGSGLRLCHISVDGGPFKRSERLDSAMVRLYGDGPHNVSVMAEDRSGNKGVLSIVLVVDTIPPDILALGPRGEDLEDLEVVWTLFDEEIGQFSIAFEPSEVRGISTISNGSNATFVILGTPAFGREYQATLTAIDLAGNPSRTVSWSFALTDEGNVRGLVLDDDGRPLDEVSILLEDGSSHMSREDGTFELEARMGERTLYFVKEGYERYERRVFIDPGTTADLGSIVLDRVERDRSSPLKDLFGDPLIIFLMVLLAVLLVLAAVNLYFWLKDRDLLPRWTRRPSEAAKARSRPSREDERRGRKGERYSPGKR